MFVVVNYKMGDKGRVLFDLLADHLDRLQVEDLRFLQFFFLDLFQLLHFLYRLLHLLFVPALAFLLLEEPQLNGKREISNRKKYDLYV